MRRFAVVVGFFALMLAGAAVVQNAGAQNAVAKNKAPTVLEQIAAFGAAQAEGDAARAAALAEPLASADLSKTPLTEIEQLELQGALADALAAAGKLDLAVAELDEASKRARALIVAAPDPAAASALRALLAAQLERLGDLHLQARNMFLAEDAYAESYRLQTELLGADEPQTRFVLEKLVKARAAPVTRSVTRSGQKGAPSPEASRVEQLRERDASDLAALGAGDPKSANFDTVRVFFGATRNATGVSDPERAYGPKRGALTFGSVIVTVPKQRTLGSIPRPSLFDLAGARDGVHIVLKRVERDPTSGDFTFKLQTSVAKAPSGRKEAFVFVHGYNQTFADSARRAAQLAVDLDIRNGAVLYSWPSGNIATYVEAQNNVEPSVEGLATLLRTVSNSGAERIHLIAHSMGNRVLLQALERLKADGFSPDRPAFDQIVFASPDIDAGTFVRQVQNAKPLVRGATLYASQNDRALSLSRMLSGGYARAGQTPLSPAVKRAVTSVDTTRIERADWLGHTDYTRGAIDDVRAVVWLSLAPKARCPLELRDGYWEASDARAGCEDVAFRRAISAMRMYGADAARGIETRVRELEAAGDREAESWRAALAIVRNLQR